MARGTLQAQISTKADETRNGPRESTSSGFYKTSLNKSGPRDSTSSDFYKTSLNKKWPAGLYELRFRQNVT